MLGRLLQVSSACLSSKKEEKFRRHDCVVKSNARLYEHHFGPSRVADRTKAPAPTLHLHGRGLVELAAQGESQVEAFERGRRVFSKSWMTQRSKPVLNSPRVRRRAPQEEDESSLLKKRRTKSHSDAMPHGCQRRHQMQRWHERRKMVSSITGDGWLLIAEKQTNASLLP